MRFITCDTSYKYVLIIMIFYITNLVLLYMCKLYQVNYVKNKAKTTMQTKAQH